MPPVQLSGPTLSPVGGGGGGGGAGGLLLLLPLHPTPISAINSRAQCLLFGFIYRQLRIHQSFDQALLQELSYRKLRYLSRIMHITRGSAGPAGIRSQIVLACSFSFRIIGAPKTQGISQLSRRVLQFKAGPGAMREIRENGFSPEQIGTIAGASGGAKWLVLSQLDRVVINRILPALVGPVHLIGSSIGAWRFSCYAQASPLEALERFERAYLEQSYSDKPDANEISDKGREILAEVLGGTGANEIITNPLLRTHVMAVRSRFLAASERRPVLAAGLMLAATANIVSRRSLGAFFTRSLFYDPRDLPPFFNARGFPLEQIKMTESNYAESVLASGAIPLVLNGIRDIDGAPSGIYRDGGLIDYHLDLPTSTEGKLTLFPHFYDHLIPGWFDKKLPWRRPAARNVDRTLLICPSPEFVRNLPNEKIPDRTDFETMSPELRRKVWRSAVTSCEAMAEEFNDVLDKDHLAARLEPL